MPSTQYNPYLEDNSNITANGAAYYQPQPTFTAPPQTVSLGEPYFLISANTCSFNTTSTRRLALTEKIFFRIKDSPIISSCQIISEKSYRRRAKLPFRLCQVSVDLIDVLTGELLTGVDSALPNIDPYHTLVALDTSQSKRATVFGYSSWVYKATSSKNGKMYCLRRLEGKVFSMQGIVLM